MDRLERMERELAESWQEFDMRASLVHTTGRFQNLRDEAAVRYALASRAMIQVGLNPDPTALKLDEVDGPF